MDTFKAARGRSTVYRQLKRATEITAQEYGNRFLVELIQNAYDALGAGVRNGRIRVLLDDAEGAFGTLYVANSGQPLNKARFDAICEFAQSSKVPGESIGNKGVGFRSVLQISDWPEVYSRRAEGQHPPELFDGFCFRFARLEDLEQFTADPVLARGIRDNVSPYSLPVPIDDQPERVLSFVRDSFATVIRLPLRNQQALDQASLAFDACIESEAPLPLFLWRLESLHLEHQDGTAHRDVYLRRSEERLALTDDSAVQISRVTLRYEENGEGPSAAFIIASSSIPESEMLGAIRRSVEQQRLPAEWERWAGDGQVSVGVSTDRQLPSRLYNYLPMGVAAASPFQGYLDAPFYAKLDRTTLDETVPLNDYLLTAGAKACVEFAEALASGADPAYAPAVAGLLAWSDTSRMRLIAASISLGESLAERRLVPVDAKDRGRQVYARIGETFVWSPPRPTVEFSASGIARRLDIAFLDGRVDEGARSRLAALRVALAGDGFAPTPQMLADWAERYATVMAKAGRPIEEWGQFYSDLAVVFAINGQLLQERRLILEEGGTLLRARTATALTGSEQSEPTVFFAAARERLEGEEDVADGADIEIPDALKVFVRYAHPELTWRDQTTGNSIRPFFVQHRLVRRFGRRELLELVRSVLSVDWGESVYSAALDFAYRLVASSPDVKDPKPSELNLRVPRGDGTWIAAADAVFSDGWRQPGADALQELLQIVGTASPELTEYAANAIASPSEWPMSLTDPRAFAAFLHQIGVRDGLWPRLKAISPTRRGGWSWRVAVLRGEMGLSTAMAAAWDQETALRPEPFAYPSYQYELVSGGVWCLPGQDSCLTWSDSARERFAELVATGLGVWADETLWCSFSKVGGYSDRKRWPSPVLSLAARFPWMPVDPSNRSEPVRFRLPREAWFSADDSERLPEFIPGVRFGVRKPLLRSAMGRDRLRDLLGARFWENPDDAPAAVVSLGELFAEGGVPDEAQGVFAAAYQQKWRESLVDGRLNVVAASLRTAPIIVRRSGRLEAWRASVDQGLVVLVDEVSALRIQLIEDTGTAVLALDNLDATIARGLLGVRTVLAERARLSSEIQLTLLVDGQELSTSADMQHLRETPLAHLGELATLYAALVAKISSHRARDAAIENVQRIRVTIVDTVTVTVQGLDSPATASPVVLAYPDPLYPTLVVSRSLSSSALAHEFAHPICELMGIPAAAPSMELALRRANEWCARNSQPDQGPLPTELLCYALDVTPQRLREGRTLSDRSLAALVWLLLPIACYALGNEWSEAHQDAIERAGSIDDLTDALSQTATRLPVPIDELLEVCRTEGGLADVRDRLALDFGRFNLALRRLRGVYQPFVDREGHESAFRSYLARMHEWIDVALRQRHWPSFASGASLVGYVIARTREGVSIDPAWIEAYRVPPDDAMHQRVVEWLEEQPHAPEQAVSLEPLDVVRQANRTLLDEMQGAVRVVIAAWCGRHAVAVPEFWGSASAPEVRLAGVAFAEGWSDFAILDRRQVIRRLSAEGRWPVGMPESLEAKELGLRTEEIERPRVTRDEERQQRERARRAVMLDGVAIMVDRNDLSGLAATIESSLGGMMLDTPDKVTPLSLVEGGGSRPRGGMTPGGTASVKALSDEQRLGIGLVGELVVRRWLRLRYPVLDIDECWKSGYKNLVLGRTDGADSLGYDFEVDTGATRRLYEVKTSAGEEWQFALAESEVREAQRASADKRVRFRIILVSMALDSERRRLWVLPNPFSSRGAQRLRMIGAGMRFRFEPAEDGG